jgi:hypothetical protein
MFRCQLTGRQSLIGQKPVKLVVERRHRSYDKRIYDLESRTASTIKDASQGWEIAKELTVCESAAQEWMAAHPNGPEWIDAAQVAE